MGGAGAVYGRLATFGVEKQLLGFGFYTVGDRREPRAMAMGSGSAGGDRCGVGLVLRSARQIAKPPVWAGGLVLLVEEGAQMLASRRMTQFA
jgi:hypothetical protein